MGYSFLMPAASKSSTIMFGSESYSCNVAGFNSFVFWWNYKGMPFEIICWECYWQYALLDIIGFFLCVFLLFVIGQAFSEYVLSYYYNYPDFFRSVWARRH